MREETLRNVIRSVTRNVRSIIFTFILAVILVYFFSIVGFMFLQGKGRLKKQDQKSLDAVEGKTHMTYLTDLIA